MLRKLIIASLFSAGLSGCATAPDGAASLDIIDKAVNLAPEDLERRVADGDERAQYALSIVYRYGLNGRERDVHRAADLRIRALGKRNHVTASQRVMGGGGQTGMAAAGPAPSNGVNSYVGRQNDDCAAALASGREGQPQFDACGGEESFRTLRDKWAHATRG
jgi:hypothetical protein